VPPWVPAGIAPPSSKAKPGDPQPKSGALEAGGAAQRGGKDGKVHGRPVGSGVFIVAEGLDVKILAGGGRHAGGKGRSRDSREANMPKPSVSPVANDKSSSLYSFPALDFAGGPASESNKHALESMHAICSFILTLFMSSSASQGLITSQPQQLTALSG